MVDHYCKDSELVESDFKIPSNSPFKSSFFFNFREDDPQQAKSAMQKLVKKGSFGKVQFKVMLIF